MVANDGGYFWFRSVSNPPLTALANGQDGSNGVYVFGNGGQFPKRIGNGTNFWVDLVFTQ